MRVKSDVAAERAVLAGIAQFGSSGYIDIADIVDINCFTLESNQVMFKCLKKTLEQSDSVDVASILSSASSLGYDYIASNKSEIEFIRALFQTPIKIENIRKFGAKLRKLEIARRVQDKLQSAYKELGDITGDESIDKILSVAESPIFELSTQIGQQSEDKPKLMFSDIKEYLDYLVENPVDQIGISTGFPILDESIGGGLRKGTVHLFAARPKVGKTSYAKQFCVNIAKRKIPVLMLDSEMAQKDQINRSIAGEANVKIRDIETGRFGSLPNKDEVYRKAAGIKDIPYYYVKITGKPFEEVISIVRRWVSQVVGNDDKGNTKDCVIIYDYFKLMDSSVLEHMAEYQAMGFQISKLTDFCNIYQIPCAAFVQVNREGIVKETSDIISQSDRLLWLCGSLSLLRRKTPEEIAEDPEAGNTIIKPLDDRFGGLEPGDHINFMFLRDKSVLVEINTNSQARQNKKTADGIVSDATDDDEPIDDLEEGVPFNGP